MMPAKLERPMIETSAGLILEVAKATAAHLALPEVLQALITKLDSRIHFDAIAVSVLDKEFVRLHSLYVDGYKSGESTQMLLTRKAKELKLEPPRKQLPIKEHHISAIVESHEPYVCADVEAERRYPSDDKMLQYGIHSFVTLPLLKHGELTGAVSFLS